MRQWKRAILSDWCLRRERDLRYFSASSRWPDSRMISYVFLFDRPISFLVWYIEYTHSNLSWSISSPLDHLAGRSASALVFRPHNSPERERETGFLGLVTCSDASKHVTWRVNKETGSLRWPLIERTEKQGNTKVFRYWNLARLAVDIRKMPSIFFLLLPRRSLLSLSPLFFFCFDIEKKKEILREPAPFVFVSIPNQIWWMISWSRDWSRPVHNLPCTFLYIFLYL